MKRITALIALLFLSAMSFGQNPVGTTLVTATITDANGMTYGNGTFAAKLTTPAGTLLNRITGNLDSSGTFSVSLKPDSWDFTICAKDTITCFTSTQTISGTTQSLTSALSAAAVPYYTNTFASVKLGLGGLTFNDGTHQSTAGGGGGGSGTVTSFSAGDLSPLFTTSEATATTTPALTFSLSTAAAHTFFGNNTGSTAAPGFQAIAEGDVTSLTTDLGLKAPLASPTFTGVPAGPTATLGTNTTQLATTAFVLANAGTGSVTSVTGTANQITVTGTTAPTLSVPSTFIFPGTAQSTHFIVPGSTSGQADITASATGGTLNLGSTNATVDSAGNGKFAGIATGTATVPAFNGIVLPAITAPASPASGFLNVYEDSTDLRWHDKNAAGTIGTTSVAKTCTAGDFVSAMSAAGVYTCATPAGSGTVTATAGSLTNNAVVLGAGSTDTKVLASLGTTTTILHGNAGGAPSFGSVVAADTDTSIAHTGVDINTSHQVTATHLASPLPVAQGGTANAFFTVSGPASSAKTYTFPNANATMTQTIASGAKALATSAIGSAACSSAQTDTATGTVTTDTIQATFNGDPTAVTGFVPLTTGMLTIIVYPTADTVNFKVCNNTASSITPGAVTLNWKVTR